MTTNIARRARRPSVVLLASIATHVAVLSMLQPSGVIVSIYEPNTIDMTLIVTPAPPETLPAEATPSEAPAPPKPTRSPPRWERAESGSITPLTPEAPDKTPTPNLDPFEAARAFLLSQEGMPDEPFEVERSDGRSREAGSREVFEGVGDKHYLTQREPPRLRRHKDGTFRYRSHVFEATVEQDGSVSFADGHKVFESGVRFDLGDRILRKHGEDPYREEKRWFLESTSELRDELADRWNAKQLRRALLKLRGQLLRVWEDPALTHGEKATRLVGIFKDTADDDAGAAAREAIAEFVQARTPAVELPTATEDPSHAP